MAEAPRIPSSSSAHGSAAAATRPGLLETIRLRLYPAGAIPREQLAAQRGLQDVSALFYDRGWAYGTAGNYSVLLSRSPFRLLITASGRDKRELDKDDFVIVDLNGHAVKRGAPKPSAETLLHTMLCEDAGVGSVLHTHSVWNTLLSDQFGDAGVLELTNFEYLKGLAGVTTHETAVRIPIFENTQDIPALAERVRGRRRESGSGLRHAFLIRNHGLYAWGRDLAEARRHIEVLEFLFEVVARRRAGGA